MYGWRPYKKRREDTDRQTDRLLVRTEAMIEDVKLQSRGTPRTANKNQKLRRRHKTGFPTKLPREDGPANAVTLDFRPLNKCHSTPGVGLCYDSPRKLDAGRRRGGDAGGGGTAGLRLNGLTSAYARGLWRREAHDPPVRSTVNAKIFLEVLFEEMLETNARTAEFVGGNKINE